MLFLKFLLFTIFVFNNSLTKNTFQDSISQKLQTLSEQQKVAYLTDVCWKLREKDTDRALRYGKSALKLADSLNLLKEQGRLNDYIGVILIHYKYQTKKAVPYFHSAIEIAQKLNDTLAMGFAYNNLGDAYYLTGNAPLALEYARKSMKYMKAVNDSLGIAYTHINFGLIYRFEKEYDLALENFFDAIEIRRRFKNAIGIGSAFHEIGIVYQEMGKYKKALEYYNKAYDINEKIGNKRWMAFSLDGMGKVYYEEGDYKKSLIKFNESQKLNEERNHVYGIISNKIGKALVYSKLNEKSLGENELKEAVELATKLGVTTKIIETYESVAKFYMNVKDYKAATASFNKYLSIYDSLYSAQQFETLSELQSSFNIKQKLNVSENDLELQKKESIYLIVIVILLAGVISVIYLRYKSKEMLSSKLRESNDSKDKLFSIISHDLRNPFATLIGYVELLRDENTTDEEREEYISSIDHVTKETYSLLENLLNLSATRGGKMSFYPEQININKLVEKVTRNLTPLMNRKSIKFVSEVEDTEIYADANMIEIIIRNLIINAVKYNNVGGTISITSSNGDFFCLNIEDTGVGMNEDIKENLFVSELVQSQKGTGGEKGTGIGLHLCKEFVEKHDGTISVESEVDIGTKFIICLPNK